MQKLKKYTCFFMFGSIFLSTLIVMMVASKISAQKLSNHLLELKNSEISFVGDDSFISERYVLKPFPYGRIWVERLAIRGGGAMVLEELDPGFRYGMTDSDPKVELPKTFNSTQASFGARIKLVKSDIRSGDNRYGRFYYAVKSSENASCGVAQQISGDTQDVGSGPSLGDKSFSVIICRRLGEIDIEAFLKKLFSNVRFDEGVINKAKAAGKYSAAKFSNSQPIKSNTNSIRAGNINTTPTSQMRDRPKQPPGLVTEILRAAEASR